MWSAGQTVARKLWCGDSKSRDSLGGIPEKPLELTFDQSRRYLKIRRCAAVIRLQQQMIELIDQKKSEGDTLADL